MVLFCCLYGFAGFSFFLKLHLSGCFKAEKPSLSGIPDWSYSAYGSPEVVSLDISGTGRFIDTVRKRNCTSTLYIFPLNYKYNPALWKAQDGV